MHSGKASVGSIVRSYEQLHAILRARCDELQISRADLDHMISAPDGWCGKILGLGMSKSPGAKTLLPLLEAVGLAVIIVEDPAAADRFRHFWGRRKGHQVRYASHWRVRKQMLQEVAS